VEVSVSWPECLGFHHHHCFVVIVIVIVAVVVVVIIIIIVMVFIMRILIGRVGNPPAARRPSGGMLDVACSSRWTHPTVWRGRPCSRPDTAQHTNQNNVRNLELCNSSSRYSASRGATDEQWVHSACFSG
jgi:hypothetical protein